MNQWNNALIEVASDKHWIAGLKKYAKDKDDCAEGTAKKHSKNNYQFRGEATTKALRDEGG
jgi:hypothetical protein